MADRFSFSGKAGAIVPTRDVSNLKQDFEQILEDLNNLGNSEILVGYPSGEVDINGEDGAEVARLLVEDKWGQTGEGWNFLEDGIKGSKKEIKKEINALINGIFRHKANIEERIDNIAKAASEGIKNFVKSGYYLDRSPNRPVYLKWKVKNYSELRPLILTGKFIDACTYRIEKK